MAVAKLVCGACGAALQPGAQRCPSCGVTIEAYPGEQAAGCALCGTRNRAGAEFCSSCGAPLDRSERGQGRTGKSRRDESRHRQKSGAASRGRDPWPIVAGIAVVGLIAYFIVSEITRESPSVRQAATPPPASVTVPGPPTRVDTAPLEQVVRDNPGDAQALLRLANAFHDNGEWVRSIEYYRKYLALDADDANARVDMGICYFELAKTDTVHGTALFDTAIREMELALKKDPKHQPAAFNLGVINLALGRMPESNRWFSRAVELDGGSDLGRRAQAILEQHATLSQ